LLFSKLFFHLAFLFAFARGVDVGMLSHSISCARRSKQVGSRATGRASLIRIVSLAFMPGGFSRPRSLPTSPCTVDEIRAGDQSQDAKALGLQIPDELLAIADE
jgi:hypothetical protein